MFRRLVFIPIIFILLQNNAIAATSDMYSERALDIQAAFLVRFCSYVKWPEGSFSSSDAPVVIGIIGKDPFGSRLDKVARSFKVNGRSVEIRRFKDISSVDQVHILFISSSEASQLEEITREMENRPVLLVSNIHGFLASSGMVNFVMMDNKICFNISRTNTQKAGLTISSKLLSVAHEIQ